MKSSIVLGGGCFWCLEAIYQQVRGVINVAPGYAGGDYKNPTYEDVNLYQTGHAEVVRVEFDEQVISLFEILTIFWQMHDPTTKNQQDNDIGEQYRSIILYTPGQKADIDRSLKEIAENIWVNPVTTEISPLATFYQAEKSHKDYYLKNSDTGYCQIIINPKLVKFRKNFSKYLKN